MALRDTIRVYDLAIDFTASPDDITEALQAIIQEGIDSGRWTRRRPPAPGPDLEPNSEPDSDSDPE